RTCTASPAIRAIARAAGCGGARSWACRCSTRIETMGARLLSERHGAVLLLRISNPEARNALHPDVYRDGAAALRTAAEDHGVRAVVLAGEGEHFCAGGNLNRLRENRAQDPSVQAASIDLLGEWIAAIRDCPKPVIAAVEG